MDIHVAFRPARIEEIVSRNVEMWFPKASDAKVVPESILAIGKGMIPDRVPRMVEMGSQRQLMPKWSQRAF